MAESASPVSPAAVVAEVPVADQKLSVAVAINTDAPQPAVAQPAAAQAAPAGAAGGGAAAAAGVTVMGAHVTDNSARVFRWLCVGTMLFNFIFTVDVFWMVGFRGRDGTSLADEYSPTLFVFAFVQAFSYMYCMWDCYLTFKGTADKTVALDWDWQHEQFKRVCIPLVVNVLLVIPEIFTFVLQSRGDEFFKLLSKDENNGGMDSDTFFRVVMHIVSFGVMMIAAMMAFALTKYTLDNGLFAKDRAPASASAAASAAAEPNVEDMASVESTLLAGQGSSLAALVGKIVALTTALSVVWYAASLILGCTDETNSGILLFTILFLIPGTIAFFQSLQLLFRAALPKNWWLTYRSVIAVMMFLGYLSFWVILLLYTLLRVNSSDPTIPDSEKRGGFWVTVARQTPKRSALVYVHLAFFACYCINSAARIYWCKLRKENRQPRVFRLDPHNPPKKKKTDYTPAAPAMAAGAQPEQTQAQGGPSAVALAAQTNSVAVGVAVAAPHAHA